MAAQCGGDCGNTATAPSERKDPRCIAVPSSQAGSEQQQHTAVAAEQQQTTAAHEEGQQMAVQCGGEYGNTATAPSERMEKTKHKEKEG